MRRILAAMVGSMMFGGMALAACDSPDNAAACQDYIDKVNTLDCYKSAKFTFDCSVYDQTDCDISDYFECLTTNTKCDANGIPDVTGTTQCTSKATCD
jgi:hypothetical protein